MTIIGTSHFPSFTKACDYYKGQRLDELTPAEVEREIRRKIADGEIHIGPPVLNVGERLVWVDGGLRYGVETAR